MVNAEADHATAMTNSTGYNDSKTISSDAWKHQGHHLSIFDVCLLLVLTCLKVAQCTMTNLII
jgi:hypothetical protein